MENTKLMLFVLTGLVTMVLVFLVFTKRPIPFIQGYREATILLAVLGFLLCTFGSLQVAVTRDPFGIITVLAYLLGSAALLIGILTVLNKTIPLIPDYRTAFMVLTVIIILKFLMTRFHLFLLK